MDSVVLMLLVVNLSILAPSVCALETAAGLMFATKTPYDLSYKLFGSFVANTLNQSVTNANLFPPDECQPVQISMLLRHGSRFPSPGDVEEVANFVDFLRGVNITASYSHLKDWVNPFTMEMNKQLGDAGYEENVRIAKRLVDNFRTLFNDSVIDLEIKEPGIQLVASDTARTVDSAKGFAAGLSELLSIPNLSKELKLNNKILRFFDVCAKYLRSVESNKTATAEFHKFRDGPEMMAAAERVSRRLGLDKNRQLTTSELKTIWVMCGYETSLFRHKPSAWCSLLTQEDTDVLEYTWDLKSYWKKAHGHKVNYLQSCPLLDHMIGRLDDRIATKRGSPRAAIYFGHAETVLPVLAALGLFNDTEPLLASNFEQHRRGRAFRSSFIASFASNVALVLYRCKNGRPQQQQPRHLNWPAELDEYMVQLLANEHAISLPFARGLLAVPYAELRANYAQHLGGACRFREICSLDDQQEGRAKHEEL